MNKIFFYYNQKVTKGFILVDVLIGIVLISVAVIPISAMFSQAIQADVMAKDYTMAANLVQKQLELLKADSPQQWAALTLPCTIPWRDTLQLPPPRYMLTTTAGISAANDYLVEVAVTATWQEKGRERKLQFVSLYSTL